MTLGHRKDDPIAGASTRWSSSSNAKKHCRRTSSTIRDSARKDLESLAVHMPDTDARTLALRMSPLGAFLCPSVAQVRSSLVPRPSYTAADGLHHIANAYQAGGETRYALPLAMLFAVICSSMTLGHNKNNCKGRSSCGCHHSHSIRTCCSIGSI